MQLKVLGFDSFRNLLDTEPYFSSILVAVLMGERLGFLVHDGFLFKGNQLCVPGCSLRLRIIQELRGESHVGRDRTVQLVHASYFWPTIRE